MHRHDSGLPALARPDANRGQVSIERQVGDLKRQGLGDAQTGSPLFRHQQTRPGVVCCSDDGLDLVSFKVLRQRLGYKFLVLVNSLRMLAEGLRRREIMVVGSVVMAGILR